MCSLVCINSFLRKTAVSNLSSQCNFPSTLAEWIQALLSLGHHTRNYKTAWFMPKWSTKKTVQKVVSKSTRTQLQNQDLWESQSQDSEGWLSGTFHLFVTWGHLISPLLRRNTIYHEFWGLHCASSSTRSPCLHLRRDIRVSLSNRESVFKEFNCTAVLKANRELIILQKLSSPPAGLLGCVEEVHGVDFPN